ncbi:hypothetical protein AAG570_009826 [Ranatra chinensis]|uniref:ATP synthase F0 subunit 8 n=1 Tax=Ranatra chinensis TaxID=642074 RepID=A0ABD0ZDH1_9HEMI
MKIFWLGKQKERTYTEKLGDWLRSWGDLASDYLWVAVVLGAVAYLAFWRRWGAARTRNLRPQATRQPPSEEEVQTPPHQVPPLNQNHPRRTGTNPLKSQKKKSYSSYSSEEL